MTQQKKDKVIKGQNPINLLKEQKEKLGIDQYDITLYRKPVGDANYYYLHKWFGTPYSDIVNLEANVKEIFGGGDYLAEIIDKNREDIILVQYEKFIVNPNSELASLFSFFPDLKFEFPTSELRSYRDEMSEEEILKITKVCSNIASGFGYHL